MAAAAPLALGFVAVFLSGAVIYALSRSFEISIYVTNMASMIGIGVAVDYSLFIVSRFRRELHEGATREQPRSNARSRAPAPPSSSAAWLWRCLSARSSRSTSTRCARWPSARSWSSASRCSPRSRCCPRCSRPQGREWIGCGFRCRGARRRQGSDAFWGGWARRVMRRPLTGLAAGVGVMLVPRASVSLDADVQSRARRAPAQRRGAGRDGPSTGAHGPGFGAPVHVLTADHTIRSQPARRHPRRRTRRRARAERRRLALARRRDARGARRVGGGTRRSCAGSEQLPARALCSAAAPSSTRTLRTRSSAGSGRCCS